MPLRDSLVLIVDDDPAVVHLISETLKLEGIKVEKAYNGSELFEKLDQLPITLILLDVMLPEIDGLEICRQIRLQFQGPIVLLSGKDRSDDKIIGLENGADDYITKPFQVNEVVSRIKAHLRRERRVKLGRLRPDAGLMSFNNGSLTIHTKTNEVTLLGSRLELSTKEFQILSFLAENAGKVISREQIYDRVWASEDPVHIHTVTVHIKNLRSKLSAGSRLIRTVWGSGYKFTGSLD
ncbi:response regulator transcription factor [Paenibacillus thermotolerans]|uniref:response regulator transcription factor n=1 Tax=Paenibacillus thermotolerans TaxID=3027807 RepID=UPI0023674A54|nr:MULTISPECIES: response regulator transcription factor [unclassified Paenibacillus]